MAKKNVYDNESISSLKGADRVRKRPGVIFGSDGLEGCEHAVFEILSNAIDEARGGYGRLITVTRFLDQSVQVEDMGRGCPVDWNEKEGRYNWELVFCELYAGGKYDNENSENYEFSLGLNGLGSCATQYASRYMDVTVYREGREYRLHFERGEIVGKLESTELTTNKKRTGTTIRWLPDLEVFTDIAVPLDYYEDVMKRQAVVNAGVTFRLRNETAPGKFDTQEFLYENGIADYIRELAGDDALTEPVFWEAERRGRDRADKPEYKVKLSVALCFSNRTAVCEYYHNSSYLEHGGSPEKATRSAMVSAIDKYLRDNNKYTKGESKITFPDVQDCLILVSNSFSTQTSYENQTKKAITNKFVQEAMTEFLRSRMEIYFIENKEAAEKIREIENKLTMIEKKYPEAAQQSLDSAMSVPADSDMTTPPDDGSMQKFPAFEGKDLDGNTVKSDELFSANAVTVVNFWFTTCNPCVGELSELDALNKELAKKGGALIGVNTFTLDGDEAAISEAKDVLAKKGVTYQNVYFASDGEAGKFTTNIFAYPTTYVVDRNGNIVGDPIVGAITEKKQAETLQKLIDQALAADMG